MSSDTSSVEGKTPFFDKVKWSFITCAIVVAVVANQYYSSYAVSLRITVMIVGALVLMLIALTTVKGQRAWGFVKDSRMELRKVVWPTRQETTQTALIVIVVVCIVALCLWGIDSLFSWAVQSIIL